MLQARAFPGPDVELPNYAVDVHVDVDGGRALRAAADSLADDPFKQSPAPALVGVAPGSRGQSDGELQRRINSPSPRLIGVTTDDHAEFLEKPVSSHRAESPSHGPASQEES